MTYPTKLPKGGVNPPAEMHAPRGQGIVNAAIPSRALIPLLQHAGAPALCVVRQGDRVREGMQIGRADGPGSAHVHASIPGVVAALRQLSLPSGQVCQAVEIELGGEFETSGKLRARREWKRLPRRELLDQIRSAGVVGLGGGSVPTHVKLDAAPGSSSSVLVANGVESEPSLSADDALLREKASDVVEGLMICQALLEPARTVIAVGEGSEDLVAELERIAARGGTGIEVAVLPSRYPNGHEELVRAALDRRLPSGGLRADGPRAIVLNVATLFAVFEAVVLGKPLTERVLTVTGTPVSRPQNLKARFGTPIRDLLDDCGGLASAAGRIVMGGPMRGVSVDSLELPLTKGTSGLMVFGAEESRRGAELPCIRCGSCIEACPWELVPTRLFKLVRMGESMEAEREGLSRCTECGCCAYVCPSRIPLVAILRGGKTALRGSRA
jgi:electron transport complex protein RnfC